MITEERRTILDEETVSDYIYTCQSTIWPSIRASGGSVLCMLNGMIGSPASHMLQMTSYENTESWQTGQWAWTTDRESLVKEETVRMLRPVSSRPKKTVPPEDRRAVYGYRRFFISPTDLSEFVTCSEEGIWPRIESMGACILGLWTTTASTSPLEVILLTGYDNPTHWDETRFYNAKEKVADTLWDREEELRKRRVDITQKTWVELMRSIDF
ncbi:MAG: hypothetical protein VYC23_02205 [Chloroflexota bacterium]|nr:hypothetical protein [Chloroflexota bacterium]